MEIEMVRGCICDALTIDGTHEYDLTDEERKKVLHKLFSTLKPENLNDFLQWYMDFFGEYDYTDKPCECCGDIIETWKIKI